MKNEINNVEATEKNKTDDLYEKCVICGADTPYKFSTPITQRRYYVEGSGQICQNCYYKIYNKKVIETLV